ncbi:hypothetical protein ACKWTF_012358 [Chironomus riparius]
MKFLMFKIVLGVVSVLTVYSLPRNFDEFLLSEMIKREMRSNKADLNLEWQQQHNEIREEDYSHDMDIFKNELNKFRKKKLPLEVYRRRSEIKDQVNKRNSPNNHNYYMQLCHFKICNMGKRRSRYWEE